MGFLADRVLQKRFRDWKHRFERHRGSRHRELNWRGMICIWWLESCGCCCGDSRSRTVPVRSTRVHKDWGLQVTSVGIRSSLQWWITARKPKVVSILAWLKGWFFTRVQEEGLLMDADGVEGRASSS